MDDSKINDGKGDVSKLGRTGMMGKTMGTSFSMRSTTNFANPEKKKKRMILKRIIE